MKIRGQRIIPPKERIESLSIPVPESGCWIWLSSIKGEGLNRYGQLMIGSRSDGSRRSVSAHRYSYEIYKGLIPEGMFVCHSCDEPLCVNPAHLWVGTRQDNVDDRQRKGRNKSAIGEDNPNSKLTAKQVANIKYLFHIYSNVEIAKKYNVSIGCIKSIKQERNWQHVNPEPPKE